jgi:hypothetical protein
MNIPLCTYRSLPQQAASVSATAAGWPTHPIPDDDFKGLATWHELIITPAGCRRGPVERGRRHWVLGRGPVDRGGEVRLGKAYGIAHRDWAAANTADSRFAIASVIRA